MQDQQGVIYAGNNEGILEFDGQRWRKLELLNLSTVRSLAVDAQGTVYVGAQEELGFLKADNTGTLQYVSLLNQIDPRDRVFNDVWTTLATSSGVVFSSNQRVFKWSPGRGMKVWRPASSFSAAFLVDDTPYLINKGSGLCRLIDGSLEPVQGGEVFSGLAKLRGVFRFIGSLMVAAPDSLYIQKDAKFSAYDSEAKALLREGVIYRCLPLKNGRLVIGTVQQGAVLLDSQGKILRVLPFRAEAEQRAVAAGTLRGFRRHDTALRSRGAGWTGVGDNAFLYLAIRSPIEPGSDRPLSQAARCACRMETRLPR